MNKNNIPFWAKSVENPTFSEVSEDLSADMLVIGGGMAGLINTVQLSEAGYKVKLVEARSLAQGTSSHTTAKLTYEHFSPYQQFVEQIGEDKAKLYADTQKEALNLYKEIIEKYDIECDFEAMSNMLVTDKAAEDMLEKEYEAHQKVGIESELHKGDQGLPFKTTMGLEVKNQAQFNPAKFMKALIEKAHELGVEIYENSPVNRIEGNSAYVNNHKISFKNVVIATQHPIQVDGVNAFNLQPERAYIITSKNYEEFPEHFYQYFGEPTVSIRHFYNENGERELILAGGNHLTGKATDTNDSYKLLEETAKKMFNAKSIDRKWSAQDYNTVDTIPYIGYYNEDRDNVFVVTGFNKFGMLFSAVSSKIILSYLEGEQHYAAELVSPLREIVIPNGAGIYDENQQLKAVYKDDNHTYKNAAYCTNCHSILVFNSAEKSWDCPRDGSSFSVEGYVINGPATKDLEQYN